MYPTFWSVVFHFRFYHLFNSMAPGKFEWYFRNLIFQIISVFDGWGISCEFALRWMSLDHTDDKSTLVQVMAWCCQATSNYLSQCWPRCLSPYGVTRPQWVNLSCADIILTKHKMYLHLASICITKTWQVWVMHSQKGQECPHSIYSNDVCW